MISVTVGQHSWEYLKTPQHLFTPPVMSHTQYKQPPTLLCMKVETRLLSSATIKVQPRDADNQDPNNSG